MNIKESLRELRELKGKSQNQVAKETGINQQMINYWELGKGVPKLEFLIILADYYNVTLDYLVGREERDKNVNTKYYKCNINAKNNNNF